MQIIEYKYGDGNAADIRLPPTALALGFFDGVHLGHRRLIEETVSEARAAGLVPGVFTFRTEDAALKSGSGRIYSTEARLTLLSELGVELAVLADFSSVCSLEPDRFVSEVLWQQLNCKLCACGYNFRFGKGAVGDSALLRRLLTELGGRCTVIEEQTYRGSHLCATEIKDALAVGNMSAAAALLGSPYFIEGEVRHGLGIGGKMGFPTVNTDLPVGCPLMRGVYRTAVKIDGKIHTGVTNVGKCPTFGERELHAETMLADFCGDLYGRRLRIYFLELIREERLFSGSEELRCQIERDMTLAIEKNDKERDYICQAIGQG